MQWLALRLDLQHQPAWEHVVSLVPQVMLPDWRFRSEVGMRMPETAGQAGRKM